MSSTGFRATYAPVLRVRPAPRWTAWLRDLLRAIETRRYLEEMDARMLKDIGITRTEAQKEAARAPWDIDPRR
jgi:uncharacterized protein YjiS (DUF1127 family)